MEIVMMDGVGMMMSSPGGVSFAIGIVAVVVAWMYAECLEFYCYGWKLTSQHLVEDDDGMSRGVLLEQEDGGSPPLIQSPPSTPWLPRISYFFIQNRLTLRAMSEFGGVMIYFFICSRTDVIDALKPQNYNRDLFVFLYSLLIIVSAMSSFKIHHDVSPPIHVKPVMYLNRYQTEEWKGWMQVLFCMYHYFEAVEIFNGIRVFVAAYVWMTGFGNFSYYYVRNDFSLARFAQMMWRINFLVAFCCIVTSNSYMFYYICPMHTLFTLMVYGALGILNKYNKLGYVIALKFCACFLVVILVWDVPGVFELLWSPFTFLLGFSYPDENPDVPKLQAWHTRSGLDRYIWIIGMIYAYYHPTVERWMEKLEETEVKRRLLIKTVVASIAIAVGALWFEYIFKLDMDTYLKFHPYTSWIPITVYICLRNLSQSFRSYTLTIFVWLGKVTLETYVSQFQIWLRNEVPNDGPNLRVALIPEYPLLNFMLTTSIFVTVSYRIFKLTNALKTAFIPTNDNKRLFCNLITGLVIAGVLYGVAFASLRIANIGVGDSSSSIRGSEGT